MVISKTEQCTGCALCTAVCRKDAIRIEKKEAGFYFPVIDNKLCVECGVCKTVCPQNNGLTKTKSLKCYYGFNFSEKEKRKSTSGAVFSALCQYFCTNGGIVIGSALDGCSCKHIVVDTKKNPEDLRLLYGSKYLQSYIGKEIYHLIEQYLISGREVLFTGTPCQVGAMKRYLDLKHLGDNFYNLEIMCHGVPSPKLFEKWFKFLEKDEKIISYNFRTKHFGWLDFGYSVKYESGKSLYRPMEACPYHIYFGKHYSIRESCFNCIYRTVDRVADVTIGDFWGIKNYSTKLKKEIINQGVSAISVNNEKGRLLLEKAGDYLSLYEISPATVYLNNAPSITSISKPHEWKDFMNDIDSIEMEEIIRKYPCDSTVKAFIKMYYHKIRRFLNN